MAELLSLTGVRAGYGDTVVLEDVALSLAPRGTLSVLGRNGVGKTTLLATIMGHTTLHAGRIVFDGQPVEKAPVHRRSRLGIGFVPQAREIFPSLTVEENLTVAARSGRWSLQRVYDLFPRLAERRSHMGNQISGGEQQMLAIGRALMGNPSLLLMDEPMEGLAPIIVETLQQALVRLIREDALAVVLVEQSARLALGMTEQAMVLDRGRVSYAGPSASRRSTSRNSFYKNLKKLPAPRRCRRAYGQFRACCGGYWLFFSGSLPEVAEPLGALAPLLEELGVLLEEPEALSELPGVLAEPDALPDAGGVALEDELELGLDGVAGVALDPLLELAPDFGLVVSLEDDDADPDGEDGTALDPAEERLLSDREAPVVLSPVRSQPYRPLTATAMGRRTTADFLSKLIWNSSHWLDGPPPSSKDQARNPWSFQA